MTRARYVILTAAAIATVIVGSVPIAPRLVWNASASVPIGFYTVAPTERIEVPDLVAVAPPEPFASENGGAKIGHGSGGMILLRAA